MSNHDYDTNKFDHVFSGWSIWIEPELTAQLTGEMDHLRQEVCGNDPSVHPFVPHVTLMYNFPPQPCAETAKIMLQQCWDEFRASYDADQWNAKRARVIAGQACSTEQQPQMPLTAYAWHHLHYPKSADNGKGFGCDIVLLVVEPYEWLFSLRRIVQDKFGTDERNDNFIPHMSLVYAPEALGPRLSMDDRPIPALSAKYLSIWSTQGRLPEWSCVCRVDLT